MTFSKVFKIVFPIVVIGLLTATITYNYINKKVIPNASYNTGSTYGNLYNGGYFCEKDGIIYFANPSDNMALYSMTRTNTELTKLCDDKVSYINTDDHYVYYTRSNDSNDSSFSFLNIQKYALVRIKQNGKNKVVLDGQPCLYANVVGNKVYYIRYDKETASTLYSVGIDGKEKTMVSREALLPLTHDGKYLYYAGISGNHNLYRINSDDDSSIMILTGGFYNPIISDGYVYYMDCENNYCISKMNLSDGSKTVISTDRADCFNIYGNYIYYQRNDENSPAMMRIRTDGTENEVMLTGNFTNINVTSSYVYFSMYGDDSTFYYAPTTGKISVSVFYPGIITD